MPADVYFRFNPTDAAFNVDLDETSDAKLEAIQVRHSPRDLSEVPVLQQLTSIAGWEMIVCVVGHAKVCGQGRRPAAPTRRQAAALDHSYISAL